ncbi:MAG: hypothetical protein Q9202_004644 [Teloschistes flavicans]
MLYAIRGVSKGEYDSDIPPEYLQVPPTQLFQSGNEALRFQYVSLLRFAERVHERLLTSEEELNTWKDRESSTMACLAAMEPLTRALHLARERLSEMREDISFIDDVLHLVANLRTNSMVPQDHEVVSRHDNKATSLADAGTTAESLLARGTAVDLEIVQNNVAHPDDRHPASVFQTSDSANERVMKRRHPGEIDNLEARDGSNGQGLQQRLASRDAMPPPPGRLLNTMVRDQNLRFTSSQANDHNRTATPMVSGHGHFRYLGGDGYNSSSTYNPTLQRLSIEPEQGSSNTFESTSSAMSSFYWKQQESDGELDQNPLYELAGSPTLSTNSFHNADDQLCYSSNPFDTKPITLAHFVAQTKPKSKRTAG